MVSLKEEQFIQEEIVNSNEKNTQPSQKVRAHLPRLKKISLLEKCFYVAVVITAISLAVSKIYIMNLIESTKDEVGQVQTEIDKKNKKIDDLKQQQNELLRSDRIKEIAEKEGLKIIGNQ